MDETKRRMLRRLIGTEEADTLLDVCASATKILEEEIAYKTNTEPVLPPSPIAPYVGDVLALTEKVRIPHRVIRYESDGPGGPFKNPHSIGGDEKPIHPKKPPKKKKATPVDDYIADLIAGKVVRG